ncbi:trehalose-phosphatase [Parvularcula maris]|uniref:Trehalose 6-phosphate phosphatase n=1 Tax=Parvularcula maris TaxID=2965077 RepID=A0A9X2LAB7_9PROT|nr:trehalose-phosphatase [Parvularcula maris]MCQ8186050.1 trehalose-phosphatase [Parvularcula maris]
MGRLITRDTALFLDFDGTLTGFSDDPDSVRLPPGGFAVLERLAEKLGGAVALVSGRDVRDLASRVPTCLWRAGNHGDLVLAPEANEPDGDTSPPPALLAELKELTAAHDGVRLEEKARVLTIHTRMARDASGDVIAKAEAIAARTEGYKLQLGKDVAEFKPEGVDKGRAIERLMKEGAFAGRKPLFFGDDATDEDGFIVCLHRGGSAVKIGEGKTLAPHRLPDHHAVWDVLKEALHDLA